MTNEEIRRTVGVSDPSTATFIKQYGDRRTGSNAIRALVTQNFANTFVLMHILGNKHDVPLDLRGAYDGIRVTANPAWQFVVSTTYARPAVTTSYGDYHELRFLEAMHEPIFDAFRERRFYYLISVRNPYSWARGLLRFLGWSDVIDPGTWQHRAASEVLIDACRQFNLKYRAWLTMRDCFPDQTCVVHAERLKDQWADVLGEIGRAMHLTPRGDFEPVIGNVDPTHWDYRKSKPHGEWFEVTPWTPRPPLGSALHAIVTAEIDWTLMAPLGYYIEPLETDEETWSARDVRRETLTA